ncbi:hypothetical protein N2W54_003497 [Lotmaria passim]
MHRTRPRFVSVSRVRYCHTGDQSLTHTLLRRWEKIRAAPPATATACAAALLEETLTHLRLTAPPLPITSASASERGDTSVTQHTTASSPSTSCALLRSPHDAQVLWSALQRQRVPWRDALLLLPWQLSSMSPAQRELVRRGVSVTPWEVKHIVLRACDAVEDEELVQRYRALKKATYMVEFARLVSAALRERPTLPGGLLPVPYGVLLHSYELGRRSPRDAAIALELSKHMTLLGRLALSRAAGEKLVLGHASLEGLVGNWAAALAAVSQSRAVRLSIRKGYERFVRATQRNGSTTATPSLPTTTGPSALSGDTEPIQRQPTTAASRDTAVTAVKANDRQQPSSTWLSALLAFLAQSPARQTYAEARAVLAALPAAKPQQPNVVLVAEEVLRHPARRMFAGTFTRRLVSSVRKAEWWFALSLASAARYYDLAAPLVPLLPRGAALPSDLQAYVHATERIRKDAPPSAAPSPPLTRAEAATLSYPQALAYALEGNAATRKALLSFCPEAQPLSRLRSLLVASRRSLSAAAVSTADALIEEDIETEEDGGAGADDVDCYTFQSPSLSRLVCGAASDKRQRYFYQVIPASMRAHHFRISPLTYKPVEDHDVTHSSDLGRGATHTATRADAELAYRDRLLRWREQVVTTPVACAALLSDLSAFLRATHVVEGVAAGANSHTTVAKLRLTEEVFLRSVAALAAWGAVQLPATQRFHWPLAVLKAAWLLRVTLDASLQSTAVRSIPSVFADHAALALPSILTAHTLLGNWRVGLQLCARLERKAQDGTVQLEATPAERKPRTVKYAPPSPTLREAMAQVGYAAPAKEALRHWAALDASCAAASVPASSSFPLILTELKQFNDTRQLCEELRRLNTSASRHVRTNAKLERLSRRRMLLGAAFALLDDEESLQRVVRAAGLRRVKAEDLDDHGLQRVLGALPTAATSRVLVAEVAAGRCAHEHWLLSCMSSAPDASSAPELRSLSHLRPSSPALSAVACFHAAVEEKRPVLCLKALRRMVEIALDSPARPALLRCTAQLLRLFLADDDLLRACMQRSTAQGSDATGGSASSPAAAVAKESLRQAQLLFNRMQELEELSGALKRARGVVRRTIDRQVGEMAISFSAAAVSTLPSFHASPCATWVLLSSLQVAASRATRLPIAASFISHLFMRAASPAATPEAAATTTSAEATDDVTDWRAALFFFNELRHPTDAERAALVRALRHCGGAATSLLLSHRRFMQHLPEQLMLWADEAAGPAKWERSVALLLARTKQLSAGHENEKLNEKLVEQRGSEDDSGNQPSRVDGDVGTNDEEDGAADPLSPVVRATVQRWNADECLRAAQLLRRQGFVQMPAKPERPLRGMRVTETDPRARQQVNAIVELLKQGTAASTAAAEAAAATPLPKKAGDDKKPAAAV